jgi:hypothetical protein
VLRASVPNLSAVNDRKAPGDKVLILLTVAGKPLEAKYHGPYVIELNSRLVLLTMLLQHSQIGAKLNVCVMSI